MRHLRRVCPRRQWPPATGWRAVRSLGHLTSLSSQLAALDAWAILTHLVDVRHFGKSKRPQQEPQKQALDCSRHLPAALHRPPPRAARRMTVFRASSGAHPEHTNPSPSDSTGKPQSRQSSTHSAGFAHSCSTALATEPHSLHHRNPSIALALTGGLGSNGLAVSSPTRHN